ncbi:hypothetical protein [Prevotella sp.]|uniref:hypothetical protein n=1 Tax=Prevotella sp. TaxID=59823 RepID=UPI0027E29D64|nr:hypothetical protein [Prevotella sp.]
MSSQTNKEVTLRQEQQKWQAEQDKLKQDRQKEIAKETREWQEQQALKTKEWQEEQDKKTEQWRIDHDRSNTVFCEKLKIYKNFLDTLYGAVKDEELTDKEKIELQYQTSLVAMHCEPENILKLSEAVKKVITMMCKSDRQRSSNNNVLLETLFDVVEALRKDLYAKDDIKTFSDDVRQRTIDNFNVAYSNAKEGNTDVNDNKQHLSVDLNVLSDISCMLKSGKIGSMEEVKPIESGLSSEKQKAYNTSEWNLAVKDWQSQGWEVKALESEDCPLQITRNDGNPGKIDMGFYNGHYYLQAGYEGDSNFSRCLKWDNGGRRQYDLWYEFPALSMDVPQGGFIDKFKSSIELQQYIIKKVNYLMEVIKKEHRTILWMKAVGEHKDWQIFTWYWSTLACEWQNDEEGKVYIDTMPDDKDSSKVIVKLGNRANNVELLKRTLERIGHADKTSSIDTTDNCYVTIATIDSLVPNTEADANIVAGKLKELIKDITYKNIK